MANKKMDTAEQSSVEMVAALLDPRNVVLVGASDRPGSWSARVWRNLHRYNYPKPVFPLNPGRDEIWDVKCYKSMAELPETPDHLVILVPAKAVPGVLRDGAAAGARSATVFTSGFDEIGSDQGRGLGDRLRAAIDETGLAVSGPNCLGNLAAAGSLVTMPDDRPQILERGPVAIVGQSGGLAMAIKRTLEERGLNVGFVVTSGNEAGLTTADYIRFFTADKDTKVIVSYLEAIHDRDGFLDACRAARGAGKPVVVMKLGTSEEGRSAALAHTGRLAGSIAAFDAVAGAAGAIRVATLDDVVEVTEYMLHAPLPAGPRLGAITFSGGLRGLMLDAAESNGLRFPPLSDKSQTALEGMLGAGSVVGNPLDGGFGVLTSAETYRRAVELLLIDPNIDILLLQEELMREPGSDRKEDYLRMVEGLAAKADKPIAYVSMISHGLTAYSRGIRADLPHLPFLQEVDKSLRAIKAVTNYGASRRPAEVGRRSPSAQEEAAAARVRQAAAGAGAGVPHPLSEPDSKALLAAYGIKVPIEAVVGSAEEAVEAAGELGFPVVLKGVSAALPHKTEAGAVLLGLASEDAVRAGYDKILENVAKAAPAVVLDGVLVARQISGGLELALGINNDADVGPVVMFGQGGVGLELYGDVALADPDLDQARAAALVARTKAATLLMGYRGGPAYDRDAVLNAIVAMGRIARDLGDVIEALDVNPFVALPGLGGGLALDGLVVVRGG
ncbi:MAG: acetate--CoA ligase family protein [Alphaproteobacteria bacterium]|nr:acetate--CoA ligase family protein [Alphaproteobacteria bacterium]